MADNPKLKQNIWWHRLPEIFAGCSEASNIGIVINMIGKWAPSILTVGGGFLGGISHFADVLIYVFKALIRITKLIARMAFQIQFENEYIHQQKQKIICDLLSLASFSLAILAFSAVIASGPVAITLGWCFGLLGLAVVGYADYFLPKKQLEQELKELYQTQIKDPTNIDVEQLFAKAATVKESQHAFKLYVGLLIGLSCLLICGSAAMFAPAAAASVLVIISKLASVYLAMIAVFRFSNWMKHKLYPDPLQNKDLKTAFASYQTSHSSESIEQQLSNFAKINKIGFFQLPKSSPSKQIAISTVPALA